MTIGKGIAIAGIWIGAAGACFAPAVSSVTVPLIFAAAIIATMNL